MRAALASDLEGLARPFARGLFDEAHVLQQGEGGIDDAGARRIFAAGQVLDRTDEVVAVTRLVSDQLQENEPKLSGFEHAPAPPAPAAAAAETTVIELEVEGPPAARPAA